MKDKAGKLDPPVVTITKAVIPAAGRGTRMMPISRAIPKEMFAVGRKPMIQYIVEEAIQSGLRELCIVIREGKEIIREYFAVNGSSRELNPYVMELGTLLAKCELTFVFQKDQLGLGDALAKARDFVGGEPFVMMIPDQLIVGRKPATAQLLEHYKPGAVFSSLLRLPKSERRFFAGARGVDYRKISEREVTISRLLNEEETRKIHVELDYEVRGFGRTIFPPEIFDYLGPEFTNPETGEIDLLKTFESCARDLEIRGLWLEGEPFDLGTFQGYYRYLPRLWELQEDFELSRGA
jgi:UTP--glucose-1-phosphate uridylyltransferase